jgi:metal-dependent amidase/aminoacylase/carboxypeptidase family protein
MFLIGQNMTVACMLAATTGTRPCSWAQRVILLTRDFSGTVHFIFQPAEEGIGGADAGTSRVLRMHRPSRARKV